MSSAAPSAWVDSVRRFYRAYRYAPISPAHGLVRRISRALVGSHQRIRLRRGIELDIDLSSEVQQTLFWLDGDYEPQVEWVIRELLPVGLPVVDCGANCGFVGLLARRYRQCPVWFIEPHPRLAATVRRNLELNGWSQSCQVIEAAASDESGEAVLYENPHQDGSHSLVPEWSAAQTPGRVELKVRRDRLPTLLASAGLDHIGFLKVDAEGHDLSVLRGLGDWLTPERIGLIYTELGEDRADGFGLLERSGYVGFGQRRRTQRQLRAALRRLYQGEPEILFEPLDPARPTNAETLWVPRGSATAQLLLERVRFGR